ncbi:MAG: ABC transporter substrate-binding protein [Campylobacteraceae bacterium]|jgi:NitT/TauT family transport system substrate-binding protein|nr:ABC transporter substrate-binding protein [Campylobacteraceae bacterium]
MRKIILSIVALMVFSVELFAEVKTLKIAKQYDIGYLPLFVLDEHKIFEKNAKKAGLGDVKIEWFTFSGGAATNDALLSGNIDLNTNGIPPFLILWDKSKGKIKAIAAYDRSQYLLNTVNPNIKTIRDFTDKDKIALPSIKVSIHALLLQIAAAKEFGESNYDKLDHLTVGLKHPDALISLTSGKSEVTAHFSSEPFSTAELEHKNIHTVLDSDDILGKGFSTSVISTTEKFYNANQKLIAVFLESLVEANEWVNTHSARESAELYLKVANSSEKVELIEKILSRRADIKYTVKPTDISLFSDFLYKIGTIKSKPTQKELFFEEVFKDKYK